MRAGWRNRQQYVNSVLPGIWPAPSIETGGPTRLIWNFGKVNSETGRRMEQLGGSRKVG
jgi:hypothetical protein